MEGEGVEDLEEREPEGELVLEAGDGERDFWEGDGGTVWVGSVGKGIRGEAVRDGRSWWIAERSEVDKGRERSSVPAVV